MSPHPTYSISVIVYVVLSFTVLLPPPANTVAVLYSLHTFISLSTFFFRCESLDSNEMFKCSKEEKYLYE